MKPLIVALAVAALTSCASQAPTPQDNPEIPQDNPEMRGRVLAEANCGSCHATGRADESPAPEAPPFRRLSEKYRVDTLEEALAEGISVGHPAMPAFQFAPQDVDALIAYLESIQDEQPQLTTVVDDGREIAMSQCASCHAVGQNGDSPHPDAPPFRSVLSRYNSDVLEEELINGIRVTHPMPDFQFNPQGADALIAYLQSVQTDED